MFSQPFQNILGRFQLNGSRPFFFLDLFCGRRYRGVICHSSRFDYDILFRCCLCHSFKHIFCTFYRYIVHKKWHFQVRYATDQCNFCPPSGCDCGQRISHFPGRMIGDIAHRINGFSGGSCRNKNLLASQIFLVLYFLQNMCQKHLFRRHFALSYCVAGQSSRIRFDHFHAIPAQDLQIVLSNRIVIHVGIHGRSHDLLAVAGKYRGRQHIICDAVGHLGDDIGRSRCH